MAVEGGVPLVLPRPLHRDDSPSSPRPAPKGLSIR